MPIPVDGPSTLDAQCDLLRWSERFNRERAEVFRVAREAGVTIDQIAQITGDSRETVYVLLGESRPAAAPLIQWR
jgi:hypothetical protein